MVTSDSRLVKALDRVIGVRQALGMKVPAEGGRSVRDVPA